MGKNHLDFSTSSLEVLGNEYLVTPQVDTPPLQEAYGMALFISNIHCYLVEVMWDIFAGIVELIACWLVGSKNRLAFPLFIIASITWVFVALDRHIYGLLIVVIPAIGINIRNWIKWSEE